MNREMRTRVEITAGFATVAFLYLVSWLAGKL